MLFFKYEKKSESNIGETAKLSSKFPREIELIQQLLTVGSELVEATYNLANLSIRFS